MGRIDPRIFRVAPTTVDYGEVRQVTRVEALEREIEMPTPDPSKQFTLEKKRKRIATLNTRQPLRRLNASCGTVASGRAMACRLAKFL